MIISRSKLHRLFPAGFSLVELLLVMVIIAFLAAVILPAITSTLASNRLTAAASAFSGQLALARQTAMSTHLPIEVHLYQTTNELGALVFQSSRLFRRPNSTNTTLPVAVPFTPVARLPVGVTAMYQTNYSSLLTDTVQTNAETLPGQATTTPYRAICFLPNGQADLSLTNAGGSNQVWTLTLADTRFASAGVPDNYATFVVDPLTGKTIIYRP